MKRFHLSVNLGICLWVRSLAPLLPIVGFYFIQSKVVQGLLDIWGLTHLLRFPQNYVFVALDKLDGSSFHVESLVCKELWNFV